MSDSERAKQSFFTNENETDNFYRFVIIGKEEDRSRFGGVAGVDQ